MLKFHSRGALIALALVVLTASGATAPAHAESLGSVVGWVEDTRGTPVEGAVVSLFGKGIGRGLVTLSDSAGHFLLPALPPGLYTLRALGAGHIPAPARQITVLPNQDSVFTVSLTPMVEAKKDEGDGATATPVSSPADAHRELAWLVRHKQRSVLEERTPLPQPDESGDSATQAADLGLVDLAGSVEVVTDPSSAEQADGNRHGLGLVRLHGRLTDGATWSLGGLMSEADARTWRMAGEFVIDAGGGHVLHTGTGYGSRYSRGVDGQRVDDSGVGALFLEDTWSLGNAVSASAGGRFSYIGYLADPNHFDPSASLQIRADKDTRMSASVSTRTLAPGGDLLTLSTLSTSPTVAWAALDPGLQAERTVRYEIALTQERGATLVRAHTFYEGVDHQMVNSFAPGPAQVLTISDRGSVSARGMGLTVGRRFGKTLATSVTYTFGHSWQPRSSAAAFSNAMIPGPDLQGDFQDVSARLEATLETSTRVVAYYRLNRLTPDASPTTQNRQRFEVQLSQGLPFLNSLFRAQCELMLAMRNLFYEVDEGATLDEVAVLDPPRRVVGGVSVRF